MDLKQFVKETVRQITSATVEINEELAENGGKVYNVTRTEIHSARNGSVYETRLTDPVNVDFDVAITATETEGATGGGGLKVVSLLNIGGSVDSRTENQTISRVKFTLPLMLPKRNNNE